MIKILGAGFFLIGAIANASPLNGTTCEGKRIRWESVLHGGGQAPQDGELIAHTELKLDGIVVERTEFRYQTPPSVVFYDVSFDEASMVTLSTSGGMPSGSEIYEIDVAIKRNDGKEVAPGQGFVSERVRCLRSWAALP